MPKSFNRSSSIDTQIKRKITNRPIILALMILGVLGLFTLSMPNRGIFAQENKSDTEDKPEIIEGVDTREFLAIDSVADCAHVDYAIAEGGAPTEDQFDLEEAVFVTPPNPDGPTLTDLGLFIIEVTEVDAVGNTFQIEGFLDLIWCDPRVAFDPEEVGVVEKIFLEEDARLELSRIWWPDLTFVNESAPRLIENQELIIREDGTVEYEERFHASMSARYDLRKFPFDKQTLFVEIESHAWDDRFLIFHEEEDKIGFGSEFEIPEWHTDGVETRIESRQEIRSQWLFSEFLMEIAVSRQFGFYIWKVMFPLVILVAISWSVFWMIGDGLADRMSVSLTGMLTIVAYQFIIAEDLPRVSYFTFMDTVLTLSFVMMALTIVENVLVNVLYLQEREATATRIDQVCRWTFPVLYFGALILLYGVFVL